MNGSGWRSSNPFLPKSDRFLYNHCNRSSIYPRVSQQSLLASKAAIYPMVGMWVSENLVACFFYILSPILCWPHWDLESVILPRLCYPSNPAFYLFPRLTFLWLIINITSLPRRPPCLALLCSAKAQSWLNLIFNICIAVAKCGRRKTQNCVDWSHDKFMKLISASDLLPG